MIITVNMIDTVEMIDIINLNIINKRKNMNENAIVVSTKAIVTYSKAITKNTGNYENVKIMAEVTLEGAGDNAHEELFRNAKYFVDCKITEEINELQNPKQTADRKQQDPNQPFTKTHNQKPNNKANPIHTCNKDTEQEIIQKPEPTNKQETTPTKEPSKPRKKAPAKTNDTPILSDNTNQEEEIIVDVSELTINHVRNALTEYLKENGKPAAMRIVETVAHVKRVSDIPQDKFQAIIEACQDDDIPF